MAGGGVREDGSRGMLRRQKVVGWCVIWNMLLGGEEMVEGICLSFRLFSSWAPPLL